MHIIRQPAAVTQQHLYCNTRVRGTRENISPIDRPAKVDSPGQALE